MKQICKRLTVLLLLIGMAVALIPGVENVHAVDLSKTCTVKFGVNEKGYTGELEGATAAVRLYQVAELQKNEAYTACPEFAGIDFSNLHNRMPQIQKEVVAVVESGDMEPEIQEPELRLVGGSISGIDPGLYLIVIEDVPCGAYNYSFNPVLAALPALGTSEDSINGDDFDWQYEYTIYLKPQPHERTVALSISKELKSYITGRPATFVFDVEAVLDGNVVYSNVIPLTFDAPGIQSVLVEGIPIGAVVRVTEVYTGACYELTLEKNTEITLPSPEEAGDEERTASFVNGANTKERRGDGVINEFHGEKDGGYVNWTWIMQGCSAS